jgi:hypothetical protein
VTIERNLPPPVVACIGEKPHNRYGRIRRRSGITLMTGRGRTGKLESKNAERRRDMGTQSVTKAGAEVGDILVIAGHQVGGVQQLAEILEVVGEPGHEHFRVRWEDGRETTIYPGSDASVHRRARKEKP